MVSYIGEKHFEISVPVTAAVKVAAAGRRPVALQEASSYRKTSLHRPKL